MQNWLTWGDVFSGSAGRVFDRMWVMAKGYRPVDRDQAFLLPPDMREWLPAGHPVWLVIEAVRLLDTSAFHARRRTGGAGAAGYDPDMLVTLLIWAYANGITSSRRIERLCEQDVAFRVICAGHVPDHVTIARFRQQFAETAAALFAQVLLLCARLGMGQVGTVALDGTKIAANASKDANRTEDGLRKLAAELAAAHAAADAAGGRPVRGRGGAGTTTPATRSPGRSGSPPRWRRWRPSARRGRPRSGPRRHEQPGGGRGPGPRRGGRPPAGAEVALAEARAGPGDRRLPGQGRGLGAAAAAAAGRAAGRRRSRRRSTAGSARPAAAARAGPGPRGRPRRPRRQDAGRRSPRRRNVTDPDSRLMPVRGGGFIQGYNAAERHQRRRPRHRHPAHQLTPPTRTGTSP